MTTEVDLDGLASAVASACPALDRNGQRLAVALYRTVAEGAPVSVTALAGRAGLDESAVPRPSAPGRCFPTLLAT